MSILKKLILGAAIIILSGAILWYAVFNEDNDLEYSWRYKLTVEVETPEGIKTGSAVREVTVQFYPTGNKHPHDRKYNSSKFVKGESVVVDLGERGVFFATLRGYPSIVSHAFNLPFRAFDSPSGGTTLEGAKYYSQLSASKTLTPTNYPVFVAFKNIKDPSSIVGLLDIEQIQAVPPRYEIKTSYFSKYFGEGVQLKSVSLEMTNEPVTHKIQNYLTWIETEKMGLGKYQPGIADPVKYFTHWDLKKD